MTKQAFPVMPALIIVGLCITGYVEREELGPRDKLIHLTLLALCGSYVLEALVEGRKRRKP